MATLSGSTIASTYDRLLALPSGGLNGATLGALTDGNASATSCLSLTDNATGKAVLAVDGSHANGTEIQIDNSATTGDPFLSFQLSGTSKFTMGVDDSDSDKFKIGTTAVETSTRLTIDSSGKVGIGTASPDKELDVRATNAGGGAVIQIVNEDTSDSLTEYCALEAQIHTSEFKAGVISFGKVGTYQDSGTADSKMQFYTAKDNTNLLAMTIDEDQFVGIGTASPDYLCEISAESTDAILTITTYADAAGDHSQLILRTADNTENSPALIEDNDILGIISFQGYTNAFKEGVAIVARAAATPSSGTDMPCDLEFWTTPDNSASALQRMTILDDGNVGIGIAAPTTPLHVYRASAGNVVTLQNHLAHPVDASEIMLDMDYSNDADVTAAYFIRFQDSDNEIGSIKATNATTIAYATTSDYRFKEDLKDMANATNRINQLKLYDFKWKKDGTRSDGILAHETAEVYSQPIDGVKDAMTKKNTYYEEGDDIPEGNSVGSVKGEKDVMLPQQVDYSKFVPLLLKSIQELSAKVTALENA